MNILLYFTKNCLVFSPVKNQSIICNCFLYQPSKSSISQTASYLEPYKQRNSFKGGMKVYFKNPRSPSNSKQNFNELGLETCPRFAPQSPRRSARSRDDLAQAEVPVAIKEESLFIQINMYSSCVCEANDTLSDRETVLVKWIRTSPEVFGERGCASIRATFVDEFSRRVITVRISTERFRRVLFSSSIIRSVVSFSPSTVRRIESYLILLKSLVSLSRGNFSDLFIQKKKSPRRSEGIT